jgi:hypothetical protein
MYEMQGPRPVGRCWLTDCSAARHCLTDHCYQIPVQDAGCPAAQPFRSCPQERYPVQIPVRSAGCPAPQPFPEIIPRDRIRSRYPSEAPVARLPGRFRSFPRNRYLQQVPVRGAGRPAPQPFPEFPPESVPATRCPSETPVAQLPGRFRSFPRNWHPIPGYPSGIPVARLPGRSRSFPRERYPSLAVMNFYSLDLTRHKSFPAVISRFFGHPQDTRSYPPRRAVFPPGYPQIRPQTVEFPGPGPAPGPRSALGPRRPSAVVVAGRRFAAAATGSAVTARTAEQPLPGADRGLGHHARRADERVR